MTSKSRIRHPVRTTSCDGFKGENEAEDVVKAPDRACSLESNRLEEQKNIADSCPFCGDVSDLLSQHTMTVLAFYHFAKGRARQASMI